jgi:hypothetical protein
MIRLTPEGRKHTPKGPHNFVAWGGIKVLLKAKGGAATRAEVLGVLKYCWHWDHKHQPNTAYLGYALKEGWLVED